MEINHMKYIPLAQHSLVYGSAMDTAGLISLLSGIGCKKAIAILYRFAALHIAVGQGNMDAVHLDWQLRLLHSNHIAKHGGNSILYNRFVAITCPQSVFLLEKWVLAYCAIEGDLSPISVPEWMLMMDALLAINDMLPGEEVTDHETEYLYLTAYHNTHRIIKNQIARAYYVFSSLAKQDPIVSDLFGRYEKEKGFSIEEKLACLFNALGQAIPRFTVVAFCSIGLGSSIQEFDAKDLSSVYSNIMSSLRLTYEKARADALKTIGQVWNFELFYRFPFVQIDNIQFPFSESTIVYHMWEGLYWDMRFTLKREGEEFMTCFGRPFERYIQEITCAAVDAARGNVSFQNEFSYGCKGSQFASTDCYFRIDDTLFAIEAKAKSPHSRTLTGVDKEAIDTEVVELIIKPTLQVISRLKEIYSGNTDIPSETLSFFEGVNKTVVLIVSMEKVQPVGELLLNLDAVISPELTDTNVTVYHNINIEEYEAVCNLLEKNPVVLYDTMVGWFSDQRQDARSIVVLPNYLHSCNLPFLCSDYISALFSNAMIDISRNTFGRDCSSGISDGEAQEQ